MSSHPLNSFSVLQSSQRKCVFFVFQYFLYQIGCNKMEDETVTEEEERYLHQLPKSCL